MATQDPVSLVPEPLPYYWITDAYVIYSAITLWYLYLELSNTRRPCQKQTVQSLSQRDNFIADDKYLDI